MNDYLNAQQLAFILDIKKEDARAKMCNAWCKANNIPKDGSWGVDVKAERDVLTKKIKDDYPQAMSIEMLSTHLNLPTLQEMVDDIKTKYLVRPGTRKWILFDYPENEIRKAKESGKIKAVKIPPALKSLLPKEIQDTILNEWRVRHKV